MKLLRDFLSCRKQRVVLNGQHSSWDNVTAGVPQGSILGSLLFLVDDTSLFSVNNIHTNAVTLSQGLNIITNCASQWKIIFNPDVSKQAQEVIFSRRIKKMLHPTLPSNNIPLSNSLFEKHFGLTLDIKLNFWEHIKQKNSKTMGLLLKFHQVLPRTSLLNICKTYEKSDRLCRYNL